MRAPARILVLAVAVAACERGGSRDAESPPAPTPAPTATAGVVQTAAPPGPVSPRRVLFDPVDDERLLVVEAGGGTTVWSIADLRKPARVTAVAAPAVDARFVPGQRSIVTAGRDGSLYRWSEAGRPIWKTTVQAAALRALAVSTDGRLIASGGDDARIRFWGSGGVALGALDQAHVPGVIALVFSPNGNWLASEGSDSLVRLWRRAADGKSFAPELVVRPATPPYDKMLPNLVRLDVQWGWGQSVAFSPKSDLLSTANLDGTARLWNLDGSPRTAPFTNHSKHHVRAVAFSPRGDVLASAGFDGWVRLWRTDGHETGVGLKHPAVVTSVAFAPGGKRIATASMDDRVRVWGIDGSLEGMLPAARLP